MGKRGFFTVRERGGRKREAWTDASRRVERGGEPCKLPRRWSVAAASCTKKSQRFARELHGDVIGVGARREARTGTSIALEVRVHSSFAFIAAQRRHFVR